MRQGHDVDVVSIRPDTLAASLMIQHQLEMTLSADPATSRTRGTVWFHQYDFLRQQSDVDRAVGDLLSAKCVLIDEATSLADR